MQSDKVRHYYTFHSQIYDLTRWLFLYKRKTAIDNLNIMTSDVIYDFGCGTGLNFPYILAKTKNLTGIDFSKEMLKKASQKFPGVKLIQADVCAAAMPEKADKIICTYALSLIGNYEEAIRSMKNSLKEGGSLVILDFSVLTGWASVFYPALNWWLRRHSVNAEIPYRELLNKYFTSVRVESFLSGYCSITTAV